LLGINTYPYIPDIYDISASRNRYYGGSQLPQKGAIVIVKEKRGVKPQERRD
jgi:hypothetical protein